MIFYASEGNFRFGMERSMIKNDNADGGRGERNVECVAIEANMEMRGKENWKLAVRGPIYIPNVGVNPWLDGSLLRCLRQIRILTKTFAMVVREYSNSSVMGKLLHQPKKPKLLSHNENAQGNHKHSQEQ
jgi:hypothetical protein